MTYLTKMIDKALDAGYNMNGYRDPSCKYVRYSKPSGTCDFFVNFETYDVILWDDDNDTAICDCYEEFLEYILDGLILDVQNLSRGI